MKQQIESIRNSSTVSNETIKELTKAFSSISEIINVINSIASQTNLLALNAAIKAARAGEHGRGFSVVAEQVRKLERNHQYLQEIYHS